MLTSEQTAIRIRDAEINRLKAENLLLTERIKTSKVAVAELIKILVEKMNFTYPQKTALLKLASELE